MFYCTEEGELTDQTDTDEEVAEEDEDEEEVEEEEEEMDMEEYTDREKTNREASGLYSSSCGESILKKYVDVSGGTVYRNQNRLPWL